ncbi:MAG: ribbon-helix-helix protein, CopG family [Thermoflavifilum sp.]|nr:ribbon-helix-helix protein, CopG family [Thermoflavifilum sp.]MCL6513687.1 ribbon-helix-helix protein, CopG family [Alicyclobacillus sp.]
MRRVSDKRRVVVYLPDQLLDEVDGIAQKQRKGRSEVIREAMQLYLAEQRRRDIRTMMQQGYMEMARINLRLASEAFPLEQEAGGTVERLVSGV